MNQGMGRKRSQLAPTTSRTKFQGACVFKQCTHRVRKAACNSSSEARGVYSAMDGSAIPATISWKPKIPGPETRPSIEVLIAKDQAIVNLTRSVDVRFASFSATS